MVYKIIKQRTTKLVGLREEFELGSFDSKDKMLDFIKDILKDESKETFDRSKAIYANDADAKQGIFLCSQDKKKTDSRYYYYLYFTSDNAKTETLVTSLNDYGLYNEVRKLVNDELKNK